MGRRGHADDAVAATYLDVTVHDAAVMYVLHSAGKLPHESARVLLRQLAVRHDVVLHTDGGCRRGKDVCVDGPCETY